MLCGSAQTTAFARPLPVTNSDLLLGNVSRLMPEYRNLPEEFKRRHDPFASHVSRWFFEGIDPSKFKVKDDIDEKAAWRHLRVIMGSFEPKHEHKIAGVSWLMSQWFEVPQS